jgi:hypothetical protein
MKHDCATCPISGECPLEAYAPWLNEHEDEIETHLKNIQVPVSRLIAALIASDPKLLPAAPKLVGVIKLALTISYAADHAQTGVPDIFKKAFGES